ncbi:MAG: hypothetical protein LBV80_06690 [Deltaproteobacteria bacterium]|jgi:predicted O-linked N-acetylglucosamine transferase (SPINDLY family)|nr:hypothetical protein [Deltaproteobacteria bacterium]
MPLVQTYKKFVGSRQWDAAASIAEKGMQAFPANHMWPMLCSQALVHAGHYEDALCRAEAAEKLFRASPGNHASQEMTDMWLSLGLATFLAQEYELAALAFAKTLGYDPNNGQARHNLLLCFVYDAGLREKQSPESSLPEDPANEDEAYILGTLLHDRGLFSASREVWKNYLAQKGPSLLLEARLAFQLPSILADAGEACRIRTAMNDFLDKSALLPSGALTRLDPMLAMPTPPFHLAFHGKDDLDLLSRLAGFAQRHMHAHNASADNENSAETSAWSRMAALRPPKNRRIGFISRYMTNHTIMSYFFRILLEMGHRLPHCVFIEFLQADNAFRADLARTCPMVTLPHELDAARKAVEKLDLDILVYLDLGMDPLTWHLAHSRLAPVQCTLYGHPATTGIPGIDFFLSPASMEPENAASHYSETLVAFSGLFSGFMPSPIPKPRGSLFPPAQVGQGLAHTEYVCAQSLFKVHPDMDEMLRHVLDNDSTARVHFFVSANAHETAALQNRLDKNLGQASARVNWLPQCSEENFIAILQQADAVLDTPHFSGGSTSYKALGAGVPVITLEGEFMRGRQTAGLYRHIGVDACTASSIQEWGDLALNLAHSPGKRADLRKDLLERRSGLFAMEDAIDQMTAFLLR